MRPEVSILHACGVLGWRRSFDTLAPAPKNFKKKRQKGEWIIEKNTARWTMA
jgi:hypothetical protein